MDFFGVPTVPLRRLDAWIGITPESQPVYVDAGAPTYTAQTFSAKRYDHSALKAAWTLRVTQE
ncbi:MAG: hypothetical protein AAB676_09985 [Verrucomicrobiota bacterium]